MTSYKSPVEFRKRNTTTTTDTSRFQYLPADDRSNGSVMVIIGSPIKSRKWNTTQTSITLLYKDDEPLFEDLIQSIEKGLELHPPEICEEGLNGTYFLKNENGESIAVFKPQDEEGNSESNPKKADTSDFGTGILCGEGAQREVAAYILDKDSNFAGVPRTTMVSITHPSFRKTKIGSLQEFVQNEGASWDIGYNIFPIHQVQKIAAFDLRIFNNDRHGGNMLMQDDLTLTPIDHGFSMSSTLDRAWFDWLNWPQVKAPISQECLDYISAIDIKKDLENLKRLRIRKECLRTMKISTMLLKKGAIAGLTLYDIGSVVSRMIPDEPSTLEQMFENTLIEMGAVNGSTINEEELLEVLGRTMDKQIAQIVNNK